MVNKYGLGKPEVTGSTPARSSAYFAFDVIEIWRASDTANLTCFTFRVPASRVGSRSAQIHLQGSITHASESRRMKSTKCRPDGIGSNLRTPPIEMPTNPDRRLDRLMPEVVLLNDRQRCRWPGRSVTHDSTHHKSGAKGGAKGIRTPDLLDANESRYHLRHSP